MHLLTSIAITVIAYLLDRKFGEYSFVKHPVILIGELISLVEKHLYRDSVFMGGVSVVIVVGVTALSAFAVEYLLSMLGTPLYIFTSSFIASMFIAHHMLKSAVLDVISHSSINEKHRAIAMLVSRDTNTLSESDIHKAAIETYAENLSDGVVAPVMYLLLFSLPGIVIYKTVNTLDSMIGYRNKRYEKYGKVAAKLDDLLNLIPSRLTALLITLQCKKHLSLEYLHDAPLHESPNAGHPISAMAYCLGIKLGGDTPYFGKIKKKPFFGYGRENITAEDVQRALALL